MLSYISTLKPVYKGHSQKDQNWFSTLIIALCWSKVLQNAPLCNTFILYYYNGAQKSRRIRRFWKRLFKSKDLHHPNVSKLSSFLCTLLFCDGLECVFLKYKHVHQQHVNCLINTCFFFRLNMVNNSMLHRFLCNNIACNKGYQTKLAVERGCRSGPNAVDKPLALYPGVPSLMPGFSSL